MKRTLLIGVAALLTGMCVGYTLNHGDLVSLLGVLTGAMALLFLFTDPRQS